MKKILYSVAMATLAVSAVSAAKPTKMAPVAPQAKLARSHSAFTLESARTVHTMESSFKTLGEHAKAQTPMITEGDATEPVAALNALYTNAQGAFWISISPYINLYHSFGLTGYKNGIVWANQSTGAESYEWKYGEIEGVDANTGEFLFDEQTSTDKNFVMKLLPGDILKVPTLTATSATGEKSGYEANDINPMFCGGWHADYGFCMDETTVEPYYDMVTGVSNYAHQTLGLTGVPYFTTSKADPSNYDADGQYKGWAEYFRGNDKVKYSNYKQFAYASYIPAKPSAYMLESVFADVQLSCTQDVTLTVKVYPVDDNYMVDLEHAIGGGELSFSKGVFPTSEEEPLPIFTLYAYDADGYETDNPVCVGTGQSVYVTIEGIDNPAITAFMLGTQAGFDVPLTIPDEEIFGYIDAMIPTHAYALFTLDVQRVGEEKYSTVAAAPCPGLYYNKDKTGLYYPSDFGMFYNVYFPMVVNITPDSEDAMTGDFNVVMPVEGGEASVDASPEYNIVELLEEGVMTAKSSDWIKFEPSVKTDDLGSYIHIEISCDALPEDLAGRQGGIVFEGFACDFYITVNQGEVAGISTVPAAASSKVELFDLQGRRLNSVPAHGIYLERQGNKTMKRIAK